MVKTVGSPVGTVYRMEPVIMSMVPVLMDVMQDMKEPPVLKVNQFKWVINSIENSVKVIKGNVYVWSSSFVMYYFLG